MYTTHWGDSRRLAGWILSVAGVSPPPAGQRLKNCDLAEKLRVTATT
ncbi:MAG: hypothetical protein WD875_11780 [Pirellulales bacterium]